MIRLPADAEEACRVEIALPRGGTYRVIHHRHPDGREWLERRASDRDGGPAHGRSLVRWTGRRLGHDLGEEIAEIVEPLLDVAGAEITADTREECDHGRTGTNPA